NSDPTFRSLSITKYTPLVETSIVLPSCRVKILSSGNRILIASVRSYLRALRRSVITPIFGSVRGHNLPCHFPGMDCPTHSVPLLELLIWQQTPASDSFAHAPSQLLF